MKHAGWTLIELLIVIAIIALILQTALPAVEMSRERARREQCSNHLRQIGLAAQNHESTHGFLPTGGWGTAWVGDPDRGVGVNQSGSWAYQLLPFLDSHDIYDIGRGTDGDDKYEALARLASTPVPIFYCDSRRLPKATPNRAVKPRNGPHWYNANLAQKLARMDYAGNHGDFWTGWGKGPEPDEIEDDPDDAEWASMENATGVIFQRQPVYYRQITDGLSKTYFAAEKVLIIEQYATGRNPRDDQSCWNGDASDTVASTEWVPFADVKIAEWRTSHRATKPFGSAHPDGFNAANCDGSVQFIKYDVDADVHKRSGNRHDG